MELVLVPLPIELVLVPDDPHCCLGYVDDGLLTELLLEEEELLLNHPPLDEDDDDPLLNQPPPPPVKKVLPIRGHGLK